MATAKFGTLEIGTRFQLGIFICQKQEPRVCEQSRKFYRGEVPGYWFSKADFYDWNTVYQVHGIGQKSELSLSPETEVILL